MNRQEYFNAIEFKLSSLATRIEVRGGMNILDVHVLAENFYIHFFNLLFGLDLKNLNSQKKNAAGLDLIDISNRIVMQVSSTATKAKIESSLSKDLSAYKGYAFKFISISKNAKGLRGKSFKNPHGLVFSSDKDIFDVQSLLEHINGEDISKIKVIHDFLKKELKSDLDPQRVESNLTTIIKILSKETWSQSTSPETIPYDIERKIEYNQLDEARTLIEDYKVHYHRIDKIYLDFDRQGANKSLSVLAGIRSEYDSLKSDDSPDRRFFSVIENVVDRIRQSSNYTDMPAEELELCVQILVVDAFIRCKIFKNPAGIYYVNS